MASQQHVCATCVDFSNYDYDDPDRPQGHFPGFVWTSGFDERLSVGCIEANSTNHYGVDIDNYSMVI